MKSTVTKFYANAISVPEKFIPKQILENTADVKLLVGIAVNIQPHL